MTLRGLIGSLPNVERCGGVVPSSYHPAVPGLGELLSWQNGFYAFRRGLHVFGACSSPRFHSLELWNDPAGWIKDYGETTRGLFFFAEDTFGDQFAWSGSGVVRFLAETGEREDVAPDLSGWLARIHRDPEEELGLHVLNDWIAAHGEVPEGVHLFPRTPVVVGGSLSPEEIVTISPFENMRFKATLSNQIADVPDGGQIELVTEPAPKKVNSES